MVIPRSLFHENLLKEELSGLYSWFNFTQTITTQVSSGVYDLNTEGGLQGFWERGLD
jgi:hypothetical protein